MFHVKHWWELAGRVSGSEQIMPINRPSSFDRLRMREYLSIPVLGVLIPSLSRDEARGMRSRHTKALERSV
jgi:hypothetical protein